jgi:hypothetical protein
VQFNFPDEEILYLKMKDCDEQFLEEGPEPGSVGAWYLIELLILMVMELGQ